MMAQSIVMHGLRKCFGALTAVNELNLAIGYGEIYGLLGPNGAGKSTAIRLICGLLRADGGTGHCLNHPLGSTIPELGYMPQRGNLYDDLTVTENLRFFAGAHALVNVAERVQQMLATHDLSQYARQRVSNLSGGWRQRVAFAAALIHQPRLLLLDEPSAGLDPQARERLWLAIRRLSIDQGVTVLVTTHYSDEAGRCDRIGYLQAGCLVAEGSAHQMAGSLGLSTWHIGLPSQPGFPDIPESIVAEFTLSAMCITRVSDGWRLTGTANTQLPRELITWCSQYAVRITPLNPTLNDALAWLGRERHMTSTPGDNK